MAERERIPMSSSSGTKPQVRDGDACSVTGTAPDASKDIASLTRVGHTSGIGAATAVFSMRASLLSRRYRLTCIPYGSLLEPPRRFLVVLRRVRARARWCLHPGPSTVHVHTAVLASLNRKPVFVALPRLLRRPVIPPAHAGSADIRAFAANSGPVRTAVFARAVAADRFLGVLRASADAIETHFIAVDADVVPNSAPSVVAGNGQARENSRVSVLSTGGSTTRRRGRRARRGAGPCPRGRQAGEHHAGGSGRCTAGPCNRSLALGRTGAVAWRGPRAESFTVSEIFVLPALSEVARGAPESRGSRGRDRTDRVGDVPEVITDGGDPVLTDTSVPTTLDTRRPGARGLGDAAHDRATRLTRTTWWRGLDMLALQRVCPRVRASPVQPTSRRARAHAVSTAVALQALERG
jgi:hypothetical protein